MNKHSENTKPATCDNNMLANRLLKFRIWDNIENKYFKPTYRAYNGELEDLSISLSGELIRRTIEVPCEHESRFIGRYEIEEMVKFQHMENIEIYQNDFVGFQANYTSKKGGWQIGLVVYECFQWFLRNENGDYSIAEETDEFYYKSKVVGNLRENPELLQTTS